MKQEFEDNKVKQKEEINDFFYQIHGKWINETDFSDYSIQDIKKQANNDKYVEMLYFKEVDDKEESTKKY